MVRVVITRCLIGLLAIVTIGLPIAYYRYEYTKVKRVRVVSEGKLYRCGQLTTAGFTDTIERFGIKTLVNLQDEDPDPKLGKGLTESQFCQKVGVNYVYLPPDLVAEGEPVTIEKFLALCDNKNAYPILIHCKAGLHRTGTMAAFYRIEYEGWTPQAAMRELMTNGFSLKQCHVKNPYIKNYLVDYVPRAQRGTSRGDSVRVETLPQP